jgi:hypothetical protein
MAGASPSTATRSARSAIPHAHIGKLLEGVENGPLAVVDGPSQIPVPQDGTGLWIHPEDGKLHVHTGEQITETVLLR